MIRLLALVASLKLLPNL